MGALAVELVVEGGHEAFFINPGVVAEGLQQVLK